MCEKDWKDINNNLKIIGDYHITYHSGLSKCMNLINELENTVREQNTHIENILNIQTQQLSDLEPKIHHLNTIVQEIKKNLDELNIEMKEVKDPSVKITSFIKQSLDKQNNTILDRFNKIDTMLDHVKYTG